MMWQRKRVRRTDPGRGRRPRDERSADANPQRGRVLHIWLPVGRSASRVRSRVRGRVSRPRHSSSRDFRVRASSAADGPRPFRASHFHYRSRRRSDAGEGRERGRGCLSGQAVPRTAADRRGDRGSAPQRVERQPIARRFGDSPGRVRPDLAASGSRTHPKGQSDAARRSRYSKRPGRPSIGSRNLRRIEERARERSKT